LRVGRGAEEDEAKKLNLFTCYVPSSLTLTQKFGKGSKEKPLKMCQPIS
jgi:hypothetical protein